MKHKKRHASDGVQPFPRDWKEQLRGSHFVETFDCHPTILVPRAHDPFGLRQGSRRLAGTEAGSPRITDFRLFVRSLRNLKQ